MSCEVFKIYLRLNKIVSLRTMGNMKEDCMHIAPMFSMLKVISIILKKKTQSRRKYIA
jgi:hypothetical protein